MQPARGHFAIRARGPHALSTRTRQTHMPRLASTSWSLSSSGTSSSHTSHRIHDNELIDLSPERQRAMVEQINATVAYVLESMAGDSPSGTYWRPKGVKKEIAYYVDDNVRSDQYRFCCVGETRARAEDVMKLFLTTDTETLLKNNRVMYDNILDARVLSVLERPTKENPFKSVYLRYSSFETPTKFMDDRDMSVVVATDLFTHKDGSTIGYCLFDSVEIAECPDYHKTRGLVRSRMFCSGFFVHSATNPEGERVTKIVYLVGIEPGGATPRLAAWFVMERFGAVLVRLLDHFRRKHLNPTTFRPRSEWPSARDATHCRRCVKPFKGLPILRHHCSACGEVFCKSCSVKENVDLPGVGITAARFCRNCLTARGLDHRMTQVAESETMQSMRSMRSNSHKTHRDNSRRRATMEPARSTRSAHAAFSRTLTLPTELDELALSSSSAFSSNSYERLWSRS